MEDYEGGLDQGVPEPSPLPGGELLDSVVRPALVAATESSSSPPGSGDGSGTPWSSPPS